MKWKGIVTDTTDVDDTEGVSVYQQNTRMLIEGELQRRHGLIATGLSKANGAILNLAGGSGFIVTGIDGQADGVPDTVSATTGPKRKPPVIVQSGGAAWVMNDTGAIFSGGTRYATTASGGSIDGLSCFGQLNLSVDGGGFACSGTVTVYRERPAGGLLLIQSSLRTDADFNFAVTIPFNSDYTRIYVTILQLTGSFALHASGLSDAVCG